MTVPHYGLEQEVAEDCDIHSTAAIVSRGRTEDGRIARGYSIRRREMCRRLMITRTRWVFT